MGVSLAELDTTNLIELVGEKGLLEPAFAQFLAANVVRGERLYARDEYEADEYDLYVLRRAGDLAPWSESG